jgi:hypothetical protein
MEATPREAHGFAFEIARKRNIASAGTLQLPSVPSRGSPLDVSPLDSRPNRCSAKVVSLMPKAGLAGPSADRLLIPQDLSYVFAVSI